MDDQWLIRSPEMMSADDTALLVVDVQEKLIPLVEEHRRIVWNIGRLIDGARTLGLPVLATEQYPQGLGSTVEPLRAKILAAGGSIPEKTTFSCRQCGDLFAPLVEQGIDRLLVCGIEAHVCVQQTVFDLLASVLRVYVAVDAVGSRGTVDYETALRRMEMGGATLTTTEAALFEWCQQSGTPQFKQISELVKQPGPV